MGPWSNGPMGPSKSKQIFGNTRIHPKSSKIIKKEKPESIQIREVPTNK
jgi:hypothetical protein